ncbi:MAG: BolA/IbaG family iron-sulfur metabolism protein [SAR324 cluster bacterium]|nr:BolA/IbaG family iron-sulfur metabolism protein [SAR324 cluster bacterium]
MRVQERIEGKLKNHFSPTHLEVHNESHKHHVPPGSESHFKVIVVSEKFAGQRLKDRHQQVYTCLAEEMSGPIHALAIQAKTTEEWNRSSQQFETPNCLGGSKHDPVTPTALKH